MSGSPPPATSWHDRVADGFRVRDGVFVFAIWAGPSLLIALVAGFDPVGLGLGLTIFFGGIVLLATRGFALRALRRPAVRRALVDAFQVRLFAILLLPFALINDVVCGAVSVSVAVGLLGDANDLVLSAAATLIEGTLLAVELLAITWFAFLRRRGAGWALRPRGICIGCGYDLRGRESPHCPECGTATDAVL